MSANGGIPMLCVVVAFRNMEREAPRTLHTLSTTYQIGVTARDYEVIVVDAGSRVPIEPAFVTRFGPNFRLIRFADRASPAAAINAAAEQSRSAAICICIDGARMLSPGIIRLMLQAMRAWDNPVVATLAWHLGPKVQNDSVVEGYNQIAEDRLLASVDWQANGYELFRISTLAGSSNRGWFLPISESNCLAIRRDLWKSLGGLCEHFATPGGGYVNLDFYRRSCLGTQNLVMLLGEGTFHQFHGGVSTNVPRNQRPLDLYQTEYTSIRGGPYEPPQVVPEFLGTAPPQTLPFIARSIEQLSAHLEDPAR